MSISFYSDALDGLSDSIFKYEDGTVFKPLIDPYEETHPLYGMEYNELCDALEGSFRPAAFIVKLNSKKEVNIDNIFENSVNITNFKYVEIPCIKSGCSLGENSYIDYNYVIKEYNTAISFEIQSNLYAKIKEYKNNFIICFSMAENEYYYSLTNAVISQSYALGDKVKIVVASKGFHHF